MTTTTMKDLMMMRSLSNNNNNNNNDVNESDDDDPRGLIHGYDGEFYDFGGDDDDYEDDGFEIPLWAAMLFVMFLATFLCWLVFYLSYKHERIVEDSKQGASTRTAEGKDNNDVENPTKERDGLSIRKYELLNGRSSHTEATAGAAVSVITEDSYSVASSSSSNLPTSPKDDQQIISVSTRSAVSTKSTKSSATSAKIIQLLCEPRCVLCSKAFQEGDDVVESNSSDARNPNNQCQHHFHHDCLTKFWDKNPKKDGTCPICKQQFIAEMSANA